MIRITIRSVALACLCLLTACEPSSEKISPGDTNQQTQSAQPGISASVAKDASAAMFSAGRSAISKAQASTAELASSITRLLAEPNEQNLKTAQAQWQNANLAYRHFFYFRQLGLVEPEIFAALNRLDFQIATYPIQPGFLDTFGPYKYSGLVHDVGFPLSKESLTNQHGLTDVADVVLGLYAIEFLLFNVDASRVFADFVEPTALDASQKERGFKQISETPHHRRRELLRMQISILSEDLKSIANAWTGQTKESAMVHWNQMSVGQQADIATKALVGALTQVMLEVGELNLDKANQSAISAAISNGDFASKQDFVNHALESTLFGAGLLTQEKLTKVAALIASAINATTNTSLDDATPEKEHWRKVFSDVKQAIDVISAQ